MFLIFLYRDKSDMNILKFMVKYLVTFFTCSVTVFSGEHASSMMHCVSLSSIIS